MSETVEKASRLEAEYASSLSSLFRAMWLNLMSVEQFTSAMMNAIDRGMGNAYAEGLRKAGIQPDEASPREVGAYQEEIWNNVSRIGNVAEWLQANLKDGGTKWGTIQNRIDLWAGRYPALRTQVATLAMGDRKQQWILGRTEEHCQTCYGVAGRVYRASTWAANNCLPRSQALCCHGFRCDCGLVETEIRITPGPFPRGLMCG